MKTVHSLAQLLSNLYFPFYPFIIHFSSQGTIFVPVGEVKWQKGASEILKSTYCQGVWWGVGKGGEFEGSKDQIPNYRLLIALKVEK